MQKDFNNHNTLHYIHKEKKTLNILHIHTKNKRIFAIFNLALHMHFNI